MQKESQAEPVLFLLHYEFKIAGLIHLLKVVWWCTFDIVETLYCFSRQNSIFYEQFALFFTCFKKGHNW